VEVILAEFGHVNQALDEEVVDRDEHPKLVTALTVPLYSSPMRSRMK